MAQVELDAMPEPLLGHRRYRCGNDMVCAFAGSLGGEDGINIVAGTGSIGYGERRGKSARAGGWGEVFGDEGSAYWIAVQGLNVFTRMSDGRLPKGPLHAAFKAGLGLGVDLDLGAKVMNAPARGSIAALSKLVARAAQDGDSAAIRIFDEAARELAAVVEAVRQALEFEPGEGVAVSYSGGVFNAGALILAPLQRHLVGAVRRLSPAGADRPAEHRGRGLRRQAGGATAFASGHAASGATAQRGSGANPMMPRAANSVCSPSPLWQGCIRPCAPGIAGLVAGPSSRLCRRPGYIGSAPRAMPGHKAEGMTNRVGVVAIEGTDVATLQICHIRRCVRLARSHGRGRRADDIPA